MAGRRRVKPSYDVTHFLMLPTNAVTHLIHLCGHPLLPRGHAQVKGVTVHDLGSIYRGGISTMLFAGIQDEQLGGFRERILNWQRKVTGDGKVPVPFHICVLPCIQWF